MDVNNNQIYFNVKDNQVSVKSRGPISLEEMMQVTMTGLIGAMNSCLKAAKNDEEHKQLKEYIYDRFNQAASRTLEIFAPELELRPNITVDAIKRAEDDLMREEMAKADNDENYKVRY
jgi:hypothetical protein